MKKVIFIGLILLINGVNTVHCSVIEDVLWTVCIREIIYGSKFPEIIVR